MTETKLKAILTRKLRKDLSGAVVLRHEDQYSSGIPDISITWKGSTTWLEVKLAKPKLIGKGIQRITMQCLAENGQCWYAIYLLENDLNKWTIFADPRIDWEDSKEICSSFNHQFVVDCIKKIHKGDG